MPQTEAPRTPNEEPPVPLTSKGEPDKRYTAGGSQSREKRGETRKRPRTPTQRGPINYSDLHKTLKDGAMGCALGILMVTQPGGISVEAVAALESRAEKMAASWTALARTDERVARYLAQLLSGGVWLAAVGNSLAFAVMLGAFSGRLHYVPPPAVYFIPELQPFMRAPTMPSDNGNQSPGDSEGRSPGSSLGDVPPSSSE